MLFLCMFFVKRLNCKDFVEIFWLIFVNEVVRLWWIFKWIFICFDEFEKVKSFVYINFILYKKFKVKKKIKLYSNI